MKDQQDAKISFFEKYLTLWVALCIAGGISIGKLFPGVPEFLGRLEIANVSIPIAVLIWIMIYPMMLKVDFTSLAHHIRQPKGLALTLTINWAVKPFTMYLISWGFFFFVFKAWIPEEAAREYLAGAVLLGVAPCTAMVFVWSLLTKGSPSYTVLQVAVNDLVILVLFAPLTAFLLGVGDVTVPYDTLFLSVFLFVVIPLAGGILTRRRVVRKKGEAHFEKVFLKRFDGITVAGLLLTLVLIFLFQGDRILENPLHILLIAVPLILQTFLIFFLAYAGAKVMKLPHEVASPAAMIGASNFFELAVAVAISLFGLHSGAALATVVGVLVEVPVMLSLVKLSNATRPWFDSPREAA